MNRIFKAGLILVIIGFVSSIVFGVLAGEEFPAYFGNEEYEYTELTYSADEFATFDINLENKAVTILPSTSGNIEVKYYESEHDSVTVDDDSLTLILDNDTKWYYNWGLWFNIFRSGTYNHFYLYLPTDTAYDIDLNTANGDIICDDSLLAGNVSLETANGDITVAGLSVSGSLVMTSLNGIITVENADIGTDLEITTSNGRIVLDDVNAPEIDLQTFNGKIKATGVVVEDLIAKSSNGEIEIGISGAFQDYHVEMTTTNGNYYLNDEKVTTNAYHTDKTNDIELETVNGDVKITFID